MRFESKAQARRHVWDLLEAEQFAQSPLPAHGRIPNFVGAEAAAARLFEQSPWREAVTLKINPDSPQRAVRLMALARGVRVYVPTPRLTDGFHLLDPQRIPAHAFDAAATLQSMREHSILVPLRELPAFDAIVTGCVAVTASGKRCGKGAGYSDIEFGILRELGFDAVPVATTVHEAQIVADFPVESNDLPLTLICTPQRSLFVANPMAAPGGVEWERLSAADIERMPLLAELRALKEEAR
ncbi:MAG: hypothetical protein KDI31_16035 [Pseudomonadales bacterium]|nr:hypothetical protein [Pseudomonadales bacterium]